MMYLRGFGAPAFEYGVLATPIIASTSAPPSKRVLLSRFPGIPQHPSLSGVDMSGLGKGLAILGGIAFAGFALSMVGRGKRRRR